jgi:TP901 family phage tail tape measure protein
MSVRTDVVNLNINVNGDKARNELGNLKKRAADLTFEMNGLKKGTAEYIAKAKELSQVNAEMVALKKTIGITALNQRELVQELRKLHALRGSVTPFTKEYKEFDDQIKKVEKRLYDVKNGVQGVASFFSRIKDEVKQFGVLAAGYLGFQFITAQFSNIIRGAGKLSDQLADLRRVAGLTADEATNLNNRFKELDTRTSTEGLREIAIVAGKLGIAKEEIFGFTAAVDQLVVALGDELGNADQITTQLGKILNVFDGEITADSISKLGNAIVDLANKGVASGGFIVDFTTRLAGIAGLAGISKDAAIGLAASLEELGLRSESSTTAVIKVLSALANDVPKFAKAAGKSVEEFSATLSKKPIEALIQVSEGLAKNKNGFQEISEAFSEVGEDGARVISTLGVIGNRADFVRGKITEAGEALSNTSAITAAFALKNETFGATLDKLGKEFNRLVASPAVTNFLKGAVEGALSFISALRKIPEFIGSNRIALLTLLAGVVLYNKAMITSSLVTIRDSIVKTANAIATRAMAIATATAQVAQASYITVTSLLTGRITIATAAQRLWNIAMSLGAGPIGILISVAGALAIALGAIISSQHKLSSEQRAANQVAKEAAEIYGDQVNSIERLKKILTDENAALSLKKAAYQELIKIHPEFAKTLELDEQGHLKGVEAIDKYIQSLKDKAEAQAAQNLSNKAYQSILEKQQQLTEVDSKFFIQGRTHEKKVLNADIADLIKQKAFYDNLINKKIADAAKPAETGTPGSNKDIEDKIGLIKKLQDAIKALDESRPGLLTEKAIAENISQRKKLQAELDRLEGNNKSGDKKSENEFDRLKKEAQEFYKELQKLKERTEAGDTPEQQEIIKAQQKYQALLDKAKNYYVKHAIGEKQFNEEQRIITEAQEKELNEIFQKYLKLRLSESAAKEYEESLIARREFANKLKVQLSQEYAEGKLSKFEYEQAIKQIDRDETEDRIIIAQDYSATVKKAAEDVNKFRKEQEEKTTKDIIAENEKRRIDDEKNEAGYIKRKILTSRVGSEERLKWQKIELGLRLERELENEDLTEEEMLLKQEEYQQAVKDLDKQAWLDRIENIKQYVDFFQQALTGLNDLLNNRENKLFAQEKANNDKKKKSYKDQLDNKLINQAQYEKKTADLQAQQDAREREIKRNQAKREKALNLFNAIVNTASAVAEALPNIPLSIIAGILGGVQIAAIANAPLPEAAHGAFLDKGAKHSDKEGGIPIMAERGEAVMTARAMEDKNRYTVTGTPKQITSRLNSQAGGVSWAGGAIVSMAKWLSNKPARINSSLPQVMANGGLVRPIADASGNTNNETADLLKILINKQDENTEELKNMKGRLHAVVSIKEYREKERQYEEAKRASGLAP